jgi:hypothetical protein
MSALTMRPLGPLPFSAARSIPACFAIRRANGETKMRSSCAVSCPLPPGVAGRGAAGCVAVCCGAAGAGFAGAGAAAGAAVGTASPCSTRIAIGSFTFTPSVPSATRILPSTPSSTASTSIVALSVSISAITSPARTSSPSFFSQRDNVPSVIVGESAGIRMLVAMCRSPQTSFFTASTTHSGCGSASFSKFAA